MKKADIYNRVVAHFQATMPTAGTELHYGTPFQLLVAVVLSAQCTDKRVNMVTPALFAAYPDAESMAQATEEQILEYIHSVSYPNSKSRHLAALARMVTEEYGGKIPTDIDELQRLPGVGRKTANVMAAVAFGQQAMPVDTHVFRVAARIGLVPSSCKTPLQTEQELVRHLPHHLLSQAHHWLLLHGRYVCTARNPQCASCGLADVCRYAMKHVKGGDAC